MMTEFLNEPYTWVMGSFLVFAGAVWIFGRPVLLRTLDTKIAQIRIEVDNAARLKREAEMLLADYQNRATHAAEEADRIIATARDQADAFRVREEERLNEMMIRKEQQLTERIALLRDQAVAELRDTAAALTVQATSAVVHQKMDDATRVHLIDRALSQVSSRLAG